ncbi:hypothetical protein GCM10027586_14280 [Kineococcus gypseus]
MSERFVELVSEIQRERVQPLLPKRPPRGHRYLGRLPRIGCAALFGIVHLRCFFHPADERGCSGHERSP